MKILILNGDIRLGTGPLTAYLESFEAGLARGRGDHSDRPVRPGHPILYGMLVLLVGDAWALRIPGRDGNDLSRVPGIGSGRLGRSPRAGYDTRAGEENPGPAHPAHPSLHRTRTRGMPPSEALREVSRTRSDPGTGGRGRPSRPGWGSTAVRTIRPEPSEPLGVLFHHRRESRGGRT